MKVLNVVVIQSIFFNGLWFHFHLDGAELALLRAPLWSSMVCLYWNYSRCNKCIGYPNLSKIFRIPANNVRLQHYVILNFRSVHGVLVHILNLYWQPGVSSKFETREIQFEVTFKLITFNTHHTVVPEYCIVFGILSVV